MPTSVINYVPPHHLDWSDHTWTQDLAEKALGPGASPAPAPAPGAGSPPRAGRPPAPDPPSTSLDCRNYQQVRHGTSNETIDHATTIYTCILVRRNRDHPAISEFALPSSIWKDNPAHVDVARHLDVARDLNRHLHRHRHLTRHLAVLRHRHLHVLVPHVFRIALQSSNHLCSSDRIKVKYISSTTRAEKHLVQPRKHRSARMGSGALKT